MDLSYLLDCDFKNDDVLCVYRKNKSSGENYRKVIALFCKNYLNIDSPSTISEYAGSGDYYIDLKKYSISDYTSSDFKIYDKLIDEADVMRKERIFRTHLSYYQSHDLIVSATKYFIEFFKENKFKVIVMQIVDNYVTYIMMKVARHFGIAIVGLVHFFQEGYVRVTVEGEGNYLRSPSEKEVNISYQKLLNKEKSSFKLSKKDVFTEVCRQYLIYKAKYLIHYLLYHKIMGKLEYDYIGTPSFGYPSKLKNFFPKKYFEKNISAVSVLETSKLVYIPLHFYPEATTEYWVESSEISPYYPSLYETIQKLSNKGYSIIVKEHPAMYLKRNIEVYESIKKIEGVYLIDPFISSYELIDLVENVVVWTGTSGVESIIQSKKVSIVSENYYSNKLLARFESIEHAKVFNEESKKLLIKKILEGCLPLKII